MCKERESIGRKDARGNMIPWTHYEYGSMLILVCFDAVTKKKCRKLAH